MTRLKQQVFPFCTVIIILIDIGEIVELGDYINIQIKHVRLFKSKLNQSYNNIGISTMQFYPYNDITRF